MAAVTLYTRPMCPYCVRAVSLLKDKGVDFEEIDAGFDMEKKKEMIQKAGGARTFPQIFIGDEPIGGYTELAGLDLPDQQLGRTEPLAELGVQVLGDGLLVAARQPVEPCELRGEDGRFAEPLAGGDEHLGRSGEEPRLDQAVVDDRVGAPLLRCGLDGRVPGRERGVLVGQAGVGHAGHARAREVGDRADRVAAGSPARRVLLPRAGRRWRGTRSRPRRPRQAGRRSGRFPRR